MNLSIVNTTPLTFFNDTPSVLMAVYSSLDNKYLYTVDSKQVIRKMSVSRDVQHAKKVFREAKKMINKEVLFGVSAGWSGDVWFQEIRLA